MQESIKNKKQQVPAPANASSSLDSKLRNAEMEVATSRPLKMLLLAFHSITSVGSYWTSNLEFIGKKINIPRSLPFVTFREDSSNPPWITRNDTTSATGADGTPLKTFQS